MKLTSEARVQKAVRVLLYLRENSWSPPCWWGHMGDAAPSLGLPCFSAISDCMGHGSDVFDLVSWEVLPCVFPVWDSLGFLDLRDYFLPHFRQVFNYLVFRLIC